MPITQFTYKKSSLSAADAERLAGKLKPGKKYAVDVSYVSEVDSSFYQSLLGFKDNIVIIDHVADESQKKLRDLLKKKYEDEIKSWNLIYHNTNEQLRPYGREIPSEFEVWYKNAMPELGDEVYKARIEPKGFKVYQKFENGFEHWKEILGKWHDKNHPEKEHFMLLFGRKEYMGPRLSGGGLYIEEEVHDIYRSYRVGEVPFKLFRIKEKGKHEEIDTSPPARFVWTALMEKYCSNIWGGSVIPSIYIVSQKDVYTNTDSLPSANLIFQKHLKKAKERTYKLFAGFGVGENDLFTSTKDNLEETIEKVRQNPGQGLGEFFVKIKEKSYFWLNTVLSAERFEQIKQKDTKIFQSKKFYSLEELEQKLEKGK